MFFDTDIKGDRLPPKTLSLTYDDGPGTTPGSGPGPRTLDLGRVLHRLGVRATFFAVGTHAEQHPGILRQLADWGHLVGSHTHTHPGLVKYLTEGGDPAEELARADAVIRDAVDGPVTYFRAPYGNWRETEGPGGPDRQTSVVAEVLNRTPLVARYVGPVNWDVSSHDWEFWERGDTAEACAAAVVDRCETIGRGILLMHDSSEDPTVRARNRTCEATERLVTTLLDRGFRFVRLDEVPQVRSAAAVRDQVTFEASPGVFLAPDKDGGLIARPGGVPVVFGVVPRADGAVALRASNGCYLSAGPGGRVCAYAFDAGEPETVRLEDVGDGRVAVRTGPGGCWAVGPEGLVTAAWHPPGPTLFQVRRRFAGVGTTG